LFKTIVRWELTGKVSRAKRDWRGWRIYEKNGVKELIKFHESMREPEGKSKAPKTKPDSPQVSRTYLHA
jgi:hypothetical protein